MLFICFLLKIPLFAFFRFFTCEKKNHLLLHGEDGGSEKREIH